MKTAVAPRAGPGPAVLPFLLPLLLIAALAGLHFAMPSSSAWGEVMVLLLPVPIFLAALGGVRPSVPAIALCTVVLANDVSPFDAAAFASESLFLSAIGWLAWRVACGAERELAENERVLSETRQRVARLKDNHGLWQNVALTRMGAYATSVEEAFLDQGLRSRPGGIVLDVGAASGRLEHALTRHAEHVVATDLDRDEIYAMAEDAKVTPAVVGDQPALPVRSGTVDTVVSIEAPAASETDWFRDECARVLRPDGRVLLSIYNAWSYKGLLMRLRLRVRRDSAAWHGAYYRTSVAEQLRRWRSAGFEPSRKRGFYWTPLARDSESAWVPRGALLERVLGLRKLIAISPWVLVELRRVDPSRAT